MAVVANLTIDQGSDFFTTITVEDNSGVVFDLTQWDARAQARRTYSSSTAFTFLCSIDAPLDGEVNMLIPATVTTNMKPGRYVYDVEIVEKNVGTITRVVEGQIEVTPRVTRI